MQMGVTVYSYTSKNHDKAWTQTMIGYIIKYSTVRIWVWWQMDSGSEDGVY